MVRKRIVFLDPSITDIKTESIVSPAVFSAERGKWLGSKKNEGYRWSPLCGSERAGE